jgi:hypothetical protein
VDVVVKSLYDLWVIGVDTTSKQQTPRMRKVQQMLDWALEVKEAADKHQVATMFIKVVIPL